MMSKSSRGRGGSNFAKIEGDWTCPGCSNINFARRFECNRCGELRQTGPKTFHNGGVIIGQSGAEKSRGLFSADDWICKTCGNVNWARRNDCNMCNSPKVAIQEERTGFGGGFNERQNVEYKEREESDDEYDQYGRKKRRKSHNGAITKQPERPRMDDPPSDEDDDDESGDDEDLSKYDLDGDEDDDEGDASKYDLDASDDGSKSSSSRSSSYSRSRSRSRSPRRKRRYSSDSYSSSDRRSSPRKRQRSRSRSSSSGR